MNNRDLVTIEACRLKYQEEIDRQKTLTERNKFGQFATPPSLAIEMARYVKALLTEETRPIRFSDPALGTGAFFSALLGIFPHERIESAITNSLSCPERKHVPVAFPKNIYDQSCRAHAIYAKRSSNGITMGTQGSTANSL